ncbi:MAG TPA: hypothetical protein VM469_00665 [Pseudoxanthomonas sp.]|jgi:hypothetical protein|nr:hypothetical protein [Pseudoxanthomonas sp.]
MDGIESARMLRQMRQLRWYCGVMTVAFGALALTAFKAPPQRFDEISVHRINVVDEDGQVRLVIANQERFPPPMLNGQTFKRAVSPAGVVFYDRKGNEVGGLALTDVDAGKVSALAFDNPNMDAIGLMTRIGADGEPISSGLQINQAMPAALPVRDAVRQTQTRILIQNERNNAEVRLADPQGRDRIRMRVDATGEPLFEILDAQGAVVFKAPGEAQKP